VVTPFGGVEHDWAAIELAAWLAQTLATTLRLLGTEADAARGRRDASRLLARASMLVQEVVGIVTEPVLVQPGERGVLDAARGARLLMIGFPSAGGPKASAASGSPWPQARASRRSSCGAG
jgi:hypothetical protein